jgi:uncharacterized protein with HEPN domain
MIDAITRIESYVAGMDKPAFLASPITQDAVIRNIEIIGEAARNIIKHYPEFAAAHKQLRLDAAYKMRNAVAHGYFAVDLEIVWSTLRADLPVLLAELRTHS